MSTKVTKKDILALEEEIKGLEFEIDKAGKLRTRYAEFAQESPKQVPEELIKEVDKFEEERKQLEEERVRFQKSYEERLEDINRRAKEPKQALWEAQAPGKYKEITDNINALKAQLEEKSKRLEELKAGHAKETRGE